MIHICERCGVEFEYSGNVLRCQKCRVTCEKCGGPIPSTYRSRVCGHCKVAKRKMVKCQFTGCEKLIRYDKHRGAFCLTHTDWSNHAKRISEYNRTNKGRTSIEFAIERELTRTGEIFIDQFTLLDGRTVVDFLLPSKKIVIYCDGDYWHKKPEVAKRDTVQNQRLQEEGYTVFRFWEHEIKQSASACVQRIYQ